VIFKFLSRTCVSLVFAGRWFEKRRGTYRKPEVQKVWLSGYYVVDLFRLGDDPAGVAKRTLKALKERFL